MDITAEKFRLAPYKITMYHRCAKQCYYYEREGPRPGSIFILTGRASEEGLNAHFKRKLETGEGIKSTEVRDRVVEAFDRLRDDFVIEREDKPLETRDGAAETTAYYHGEYAYGIEPYLLQQAYNFQIPNELAGGKTRIKGIPDLIDTKKRVIDWKSIFNLRSIPENKETKKRQAKFDHIIQTSCYALIFGKEENIPFPELHYLHVRKPEYFIIPVQPNFKLFRTLFLQALRGYKEEIWPLNREHYLCSLKYCGYWDICHRENG